MNVSNSVSFEAAVTAYVPPPEWLTARRFALVLAAILLAVYPGVVTGSQSFVFRDFSIFGYPLASYHRECFWRGEIPLWNPLNNCGIPFLAQWNTLTLYPFSLIYLLLPLPWSLNLFCILHLFIGGMGMFFLAERWTHCRVSGAVAGLTFAFSGIVTVALAWPNTIAVLGWMPWVILTVERACRQGGTHFWIAVFVGSLQMLAAMPEYIAFTWIIVVALWCLEKPSWTRFRRLAGIITCITAMAAAQLLPFLQFLYESRRDLMFDPSVFAMPPSGWANFLVPLIHTRPVPQGVYMADSQIILTSYYVALPAVLLAIGAVAWVRDRRVYLFTGVALLAVWLAMGKAGYLYKWLLDLCPLVGVMRYPVKFVIAVTVAVPILSAFGMAHWRAHVAPGVNRQSQALIGIALGLIALAAFALWHARVNPFRGDDWAAALKNGAWRIFFVVLCAGALLALKQTSKRQNWQLFWTTLFLLGVTVDSLTHAPHYPTVPSTAFAPGALTLRLQQKAPERRIARAFMTHATHEFLYFGMLANPSDDLIGRRVSLFGNLNMIDNVPSIDGFFAMYLPAQREVWSRIYSAPLQRFPEGLADFLAVSHMTSLVKPMEWIVRSNDTRLVSAGQNPVFVDDHSALEAMLDPKFDPRTTVFLPEAARADFGNSKRADAAILKQQIEPHRIQAEVESSDTGLVVVAQSHYKPWRAFVDGKPAPLSRANYAFQTVQVPAGRHRVELRYVDSFFHAGSVISLLTLGAALAAFAYCHRRDHGTRGQPVLCRPESR